MSIIASNVHRILAFYLPQYHPIPENDKWWGNGFTEWTNVAKATPLFRNHYQPHIPADLGFYDLRVPETRLAQAELAKEYGIAGFCYYHYWFNSKLLLDRPFNEVLNSGEPDFPFCLCWANENWTKTWDGKAKELLIQQDYSEEDDREHIRWLIEAFRDQRYIKIDGKPLFLVYAVQDMPDPERTVSIWRAEVEKAGFDGIYLCSVESYMTHIRDPVAFGFDAALDFQPNTMKYKSRLSTLARVKRALFNKYRYNVWQLFDYGEYVQSVIDQEVAVYKRFPCVMPSWDNTPRRGNGATVFINATPRNYQKWLAGTLKMFKPYSVDENLVFINAWNEWAEGNHLEPCLRWERGYLDATRAAIIEAQGG